MGGGIGWGGDFGLVIGGGCDGSRGIWDSFWISCGVAHSGKGLISVFREFSASIGKNFILAGRLGTRLSFYEV